MAAEPVTATCPMCGHANVFPPNEIQQIVQPADRLSEEAVTGRFAECRECGERIDLGLADGPSKITAIETVLAFLALAGIAAVFIAGIWGMTR